MAAFRTTSVLTVCTIVLAIIHPCDCVSTKTIEWNWNSEALCLIAIILHREKARVIYKNSF